MDDEGETELERCEGRWRPAVRALAAPGGVGQVPSMEESLAAFVWHVLPRERARRTRQKYATHRLTVLTWAVWKGAQGPAADEHRRAAGVHLGRPSH